MLDQKATGFRELKKFRQCFIYEQQYFIVETFLNIDHQPSVLRIETSKEQSELKIPSFVKILKEVTSNNEYAGSTMARIGWKMPEADKKKIVKVLSMYGQQQTPAPSDLKIKREASYTSATPINA